MNTAEAQSQQSNKLSPISSSSFDISFENLFKTHPLGVVSKKDYEA